MDASQTRNDLGPPQRQQFPVERQPLRVRPVLHRVPVELRRHESFACSRVGDMFAPLGVAKFRKLGEFGTAAVANGFGQVTVEIAEKWKRLSSSPLFAHAAAHSSPIKII